MAYRTKVEKPDKYGEILPVVLEDKERRKRVTKRLLKRLGLEQQDLLLILEKFHIPRRITANNVFKLQRKLKMPAIVNEKGTDGIFGPNTWEYARRGLMRIDPRLARKLGKKVIKIEHRYKRKALQEEIISAKKGKKERVEYSEFHESIREIQRKFNSSCREVDAIAEGSGSFREKLERLVALKDKYPLNPNDPLVRIPHESSTKKLRLAIAWRYYLANTWAKLNGYKFRIYSGFRSFEFQARLRKRNEERVFRKQVKIYEAQGNSRLKAIAMARRKKYRYAVAKPGKSDHQRGNTIDMHLYKQVGGRFRKLKLPFFRGRKKSIAERNSYIIRQFFAPFGDWKVNKYESWHWTMAKKFYDRIGRTS